MGISGLSSSYSTSYLYNTTNNVTKKEDTEEIQPEVAPAEAEPEVAVATEEEALTTTEETTEEEESKGTALDYLQTIMSVANENTSSVASLAYTNDTQLVELKKAAIEEQMLFGSHRHGHGHRPPLLEGQGLFSAAAQPTAAFAANAYKTAANNNTTNVNNYTNDQQENNSYQEDDSAYRVDLSGLSA